jgi:hypothetical protein
MGLSNRNKWLSLSLLAIILPIGTLITLKFSGIIREPAPLETITVDPISWNMTRPSDSNFNIGEKVWNTYANDEAAIRIDAHIAAYEENPALDIWPFYGRDGFILAVYSNLSVFQGAGVSMVVRFTPADENGTMYVNTDSTIQSNASLTEISGFDINGNEAYYKAKVLNSPSCLVKQLYWAFNDPNNEDHRLDVVLEATYFENGIYKRIVLPIILQILIAT